MTSKPSFLKPLRAAGAAALILTLAACSGGSPEQPGTTGQPTGAGSESAPPAVAKDVLTLGATADMYGWDPQNQPGYQNWAAEAVWDNLAKCDSVGALEADIAETWEVTNENKTFVAHLRPGLKFTDGSPVDPAAVKASFEYIANNGGSTADYADLVYEEIDENTISITWPKPQPVMANKICSAKILPPSYLEAANWDVPVGSGPYILDPAESTTGSTYTFTKNADHWNADHYPYPKLVIKIIESETAAMSALKTGQIDASLINVASLAEAEASSLDVIKFQGQTPRLIISDRLGKVEAALGDVRVRQAMNMVFDKQAMADRLYNGNATPTAQVFREGTDAFIDGLQDPYPYDVERAKALMAEAGYVDGFELEFPTMAGQNFETLLPYVTQQLAEINIKVTEVPLSGSNAIGDLLSGKFPVVLWQLGNMGNSALQIYIESTPEGWWNLQHESHEFVDSRWEKIATATPEESRALQQEINQYQIDQAWFAPFVFTGTTYAYNAEKVSIPTQSDQEALTPKLRDFQ